MRHHRLLTLLLLALPSFAQYYSAVHAGAGPSNLPASQLFLTRQRAVILDYSGNLIVATNRNIFRVNRQTGIITLLVGTASASLVGNEAIADNTPATTVRFEGIYAITVDGGGNVYFADSVRRRIYRYDAVSGMVRHWAGSGIATPFNGENIDSRKANLDPRALVSDRSGNLYIAEAARVRRVDTGRIITTFAGNGTLADSADGAPAPSPINDIIGLAVDRQNTVYFAERRGNRPGRIRRVSGGNLLTVMGSIDSETPLNPGASLPAKEPRLFVRGLGSGADDSIYVYEANQISRLQIAFGLASHYTSNVTAPELRYVAGDDSGNLYYTSGPAIVSLSQGVVTPIFSAAANTPTPAGSTARGAILDSVKHVAVDAAGTLFISDAARTVIRSVARSTNIVSNHYGGQYGGPGCPVGASPGSVCITPGPLAVEPSGRVVAIRTADIGSPAARLIRITGNNSFDVIAGAGGASGLQNVPAINISFTDPQGVAVDRASNIYVTDRARCIVWRITPARSASAIAGTGACSPGPENVPAVTATLESPTAIATDFAGNIYFIEQTRHRVRRIDTSGVLSTVAGTGVPGYNGDSGPALGIPLNDPSGLGVDEGGNLYISDRGNRRVRRVYANQMTTIAGNGLAGLPPTFDIVNGAPVLRRGPAEGPTICSPEGIAVARDLTVYVADSCNNQVLALNGRLAITSSPPGAVVQFNNSRFQTPAVISPPLGSSNTLTAIDTQPTGPASRLKFSDWADRGSQPSITVSPTVEPQVLAANFRVEVQIRAAVTPEGSGTVAFSPPSPDGYYLQGSPVTLTASPASGYSFDGFSFASPGSPLALTATSPASVLAGFVSNATGFQPLRINLGGPRVADGQGNPWLADPLLAILGSENTLTTNTPITFPAGSDLVPDLYRTARTSSGVLSYSLRVPNGSYSIRLKFAELENLAIEQRVFDVALQGSVVQAAFDIRRFAGAPFRPIDLVFPVTVTTNLITVDLAPRAGRPLLCGLGVDAGTVPYVSLVPSFVELTAGATQPFAALTAGAADPRVAWYVDPLFGGIDENGIYTAPNAVLQPQPVSVIATSLADPAGTGRAEVLLSPGWFGADVGNVLADGANSFKDGVHSVRGSGRLGGTIDSGRFVYRILDSDAAITARVTPESKNGAYAGITIRESLRPDARQMTLWLDRDLNLKRQYRLKAGVEPFTEPGGTGAAWLRLVRRGSWVGAFASLDGQRWVPAGPWTNCELGPAAYAGMIVASGLEPSTALFDSASIGNPVAVSIVQQHSQMVPRQTVRFRAEVFGASSENVAWSIFPNLGSIDTDGVYTAPADLGGAETVTVTASSVEDPSAYSSTIVRLGPPQALRIDVGGTGHSTAGIPWYADTNFLGVRHFAVRSPSTRPDAYMTGRASRETFFYQFFLPNGAYQLNLKFVEYDPRPIPGLRVFNLRVNGELALTNFDPASSGGPTGLPADQSITVVNSQGELVLAFEPVRGEPLVQGIEIIPLQ